MADGSDGAQYAHMDDETFWRHEVPQWSRALLPAVRDWLAKMQRVVYLARRGFIEESRLRLRDRDDSLVERGRMLEVLLRNSVLAEQYDPGTPLSFSAYRPLLPNALSSTYGNSAPSMLRALVELAIEAVHPNAQVDHSTAYDSIASGDVIREFCGLDVWESLDALLTEAFRRGGEDYPPGGIEKESDARPFPSEAYAVDSLADLRPNRLPIKIADRSVLDGPHGRALLEFLETYKATTAEKAVWGQFYRLFQIPKGQESSWEKDAEKAGLSLWEFIARTTLEQLLYFVTKHDIPPPKSLEQQIASSSAGSIVRQSARPTDPIRAERHRDRQRGEIKDAYELARLLRESRGLLRSVWKNEIETAVQLRYGPPHRSEYPGHVPGDRQWYDLDNPDGLALWRAHGTKPEEWKTRRLGWPELLDRIHQDTLNAWRCLRAALKLALRLPDAIRERIHDPKELDGQQRLIRALRDAEGHLGQIIPYTSVSTLLESAEVLSPTTAWSVLSRYLDIQRASVASHEKLAGELQPTSGSAAVDRWNLYAEFIGREFNEDANQLDAFIEPVSDAATSLEATLDSEAATGDIPFDPRPITRDDLNLIRRLLQEFADSCERCSSVLTGKVASHESAETLWNDAVSLLGQLLNLIGPERIGRFIIPDRELRQTLAKGGAHLDEHKKPFTRDLAYHEGNAVHYLNLAAIESRLEILGCLPKSLDGGKTNGPAPELPSDAFRLKASGQQKELFRFLRQAGRITIDRLHREFPEWKLNPVQSAAVQKALRGLDEKLTVYGEGWRLEKTRGANAEVWLVSPD